MSRTRIAQISAGIAALVGAIVFGVAGSTAGAVLVSADGAGTSQPPPTPTPDGHGWIN